MKMPGFLTVWHHDGHEKYVCEYCGGRSLELRYLRRHLESPGHKQMKASLEKDPIRSGNVSQGSAHLSRCSPGATSRIYLDESSRFSPGATSRLYLDESSGIQNEPSLEESLDLHLEQAHHELPSPQDYLIPLDMNDKSGFGFGGSEGNSDDSSEIRLNWDQWLMDDPLSLAFQSVVPENFNLPGDEDMPEIEEELEPSAQWYPFPEKMYLIAALMLGHLHHIMSRAMYHQIRLLLQLCQVNIPHWETIRRRREKIRKMLNINIMENLSVLNNKCYSLSLKDIISHEVGNPYVSKHLEFYPHETYGKNIHSLSQSQKWREGLSRHGRVQMVENGKKHYYIFEPITLKGPGQNIVVPIFFFKVENKLHAKCITPKLNDAPSQAFQYGTPNLAIMVPSLIGYNSPELHTICVDQFDLIYSEMPDIDGKKFINKINHHIIEVDEYGHHSSIPVPNPWRNNAKGKVIRHVPITLYSDDTSGNQSKRWNKHVSYYFTLSGLPPSHSNMEYNCHFVSTSNVAGPLELGESVVQEMNSLTIEGTFAYDATLQDEVLIMSMVLCYLGDSPMAAEVTNTPIPGNCKNPCRMCHLRVDEVKERSGLDYIYRFFGIKSLPAPRRWYQTVQKTNDAWNVLKTKSKAEYDKHMNEFGLVDKLQDKLIELRRNNPHDRQRIEAIEKAEPHRLCNVFTNLLEFDGCQDTPVEILHVFSLGIVKYLVRDFMEKQKDLSKMEALFNSVNLNGLNIPPIHGKYMITHWKSFVGKDFRTIVQLAPFVFFPFMDESQKKIWIPLCTIGSLIFQTTIEDMDQYIAELEKQIQILMYHILMMTAQWANKPKLHIILHLPESIKRFGPPTLFATEKFESFNGRLRHTAVHTNRLSPGHDIAISFSNYHIMRLILSGGYMFDHNQKKYYQASNQVRGIFSGNPAVQKAMGFNPPKAMNIGQYPCVKSSRVPEDEAEPVPDSLRRYYPNSQIKQVCSLSLNDKESIQKDSFVIEDAHHGNVGISCVISIWEVIHPKCYIIKIVECKLCGLQKDSSLRIVEKDVKLTYIPASKIICCVNAQHNCFDGGCHAGISNRSRRHRQEGTTVSREVHHKPYNSYLLNAFSHCHSEMNRSISQLQADFITEHDMQTAASCGQKIWNNSQSKKKGKNVESTSRSNHTQFSPQVESRSLYDPNYSPSAVSNYPNFSPQATPMTYHPPLPHLASRSPYQSTSNLSQQPYFSPHIAPRASNNPQYPNYGPSAASNSRYSM